MSQRFQEFTAKSIIAENKWRIHVGNPYVEAYATAYAAYKDTLDRQKEADKEAGELFVTAACVATGSFLLASIGKVSMQMIAKRTVVHIANSSLMKNFSNVFKIVRKNEGVAFAVGKFVDGASGKLKSNADKIATSYLQTTSSVVSREPVVQLLQMDTFMRANMTCGLEMAQMIEQTSDCSEAEKNAAYDSLLRAPLYNEPKKRQSKYGASLAELIELTFYLSAVLETDTLINWPASYAQSGAGGMLANARRATSVSINKSPNAPDYPKPAVPRPDVFGNTPAHQSIGISRAGGEVQERTNELCMKVFHKPLYGSSFFGLMGPADTEKRTELKQADTFLTELATNMKPVNPLDAIH